MSGEPQLERYQRRFNLTLLERARRIIVSANVGSLLDVSRRSFLGLSAATAFQQLLQGLPQGEEFAVVRKGEVLQVVLDREHHWTIDPKIFGSTATLGWTRRKKSVRIRLRNGFLPG